MWEAIKDAVFWVIQAFHNICFDWGLAIIIVTIIFRAIITPLMIKQSKSSYEMQKIQPRIKEIQTRFAGDQVRMNEEMQKMYAETKFNPLAGCVPMLIQMPIFVALFQVLREMGSRVDTSTSYSFFSIIPDLVKTPSDVFFEIGQNGVLPFIPYVILLLIFALATFIPTLITQRNTQDSSQKRQTMIMMAVMTVMFIWIGWGSPAGVLLFWGVSSLLAIAQSQGSMAYFRSKDKQNAEVAAAAPAAPIHVDVTRKKQHKRPSKKR